MKRWLEVLVLVGTLLVFSEAPAAASGVNWRLNHDGQTVEVSVKIAFWRAGVMPTPEQVASTVKGMIAAWEGQPFLCYKLHFDVKAIAVADPTHVPAGYIGVRLIVIPSVGDVLDQLRTVPYTRSYIGSTSDGTYFGDDPINVSIADTGPPLTTLANEKQDHAWGILDQSRLWIADPRVMMLSHEFGHIIGLHDSYGPNGELRKYMLEDLMFNSGSTGAGELWPESITKAVRRGGIKAAELKCSRHVESTPIDLKLVPSNGGALKLDAMAISIDNCEWLPPTVDPLYSDKKNVWEGTLRYRPSFASATELAGYDIKKQFAASGEQTETVRFETSPYRRMSGTHDWEHKDLFKDANLHVDASFLTLEKEVQAKDLTIRASYKKNDTGIMGFEHGLPLTVTVQRGCKR